MYIHTYIIVANRPGMLGLVPMASRLGQNTYDVPDLHLSWSSIALFCCLHVDGQCFLIHVYLALSDTHNATETRTVQDTVLFSIFAEQNAMSTTFNGRRGQFDLVQQGLIILPQSYEY